MIEGILLQGLGAMTAKGISPVREEKKRKTKGKDLDNEDFVFAMNDFKVKKKSVA